MMIQSILYGNGINRLTTGMPSWDDLIKDLFKVEMDAKIPNPLKYEALLMKKPYRDADRLLITRDGKQLMTRDGKRISVLGELTEDAIKDTIANSLKMFESNEIYKAITELPFSHYITTNYDMSLFKSLEGKFNVTKVANERLYSIRRHYDIDYQDGSERKTQYWPIHGSIENPKSIMLGFDHYCGSLAKIEDYVKGVYDMQGIKHESLANRLQKGMTDVLSWIDLFFVADVHIIGLNLGYEETDLWWILNKRRRLKRWEPELIQNRIYYYPVERVGDDMQQLFSSFEVEVVMLDDVKMKGLFMPRYRAQMESMGKNLRFG